MLGSLEQRLFRRCKVRHRPAARRVVRPAAYRPVLRGSAQHEQAARQRQHRQGPSTIRQGIAVQLLRRRYPHCDQRRRSARLRVRVRISPLVLLRYRLRSGEPVNNTSHAVARRVDAVHQLSWHHIHGAGARTRTSGRYRRGLVPRKPDGQQRASSSPRRELRKRHRVTRRALHPVRKRREVAVHRICVPSKHAIAAWHRDRRRFGVLFRPRFLRRGGIPERRNALGPPVPRGRVRLRKRSRLLRRYNRSR